MLLQKDFPEVVPFQNDFHVSSSHLSGFDCSILLALSKTQMEQEKKMLPACIKFIQTLEVKMRWAFALFFWLPCFAKGEYFLFGLVARESDFFFSLVHPRGCRFPPDPFSCPSDGGALRCYVSFHSKTTTDKDWWVPTAECDGAECYVQKDATSAGNEGGWVVCTHDAFPSPHHYQIVCTRKKSLVNPEYLS